jgi:hypothetical protein
MLQRNAEGLDPADLRHREHLAAELVAGRLDLQFWISGEA